jgi:hypothetical protein
MGFGDLDRITASAFARSEFWEKPLTTAIARIFGLAFRRYRNLAMAQK